MVIPIDDIPPPLYPLPPGEGKAVIGELSNPFRKIGRVTVPAEHVVVETTRLSLKSSVYKGGFMGIFKDSI